LRQPNFKSILLYHNRLKNKDLIWYGNSKEKN
jgi:hypothetical protein